MIPDPVCGTQQTPTCRHNTPEQLNIKKFSCKLSAMGVHTSISQKTINWQHAWPKFDCLPMPYRTGSLSSPSMYTVILRLRELPTTHSTCDNPLDNGIPRMQSYSFLPSSWRSTWGVQRPFHLIRQQWQGQYCNTWTKGGWCDRIQITARGASEPLLLKWSSQGGWDVQATYEVISKQDFGGKAKRKQSTKHGWEDVILRDRGWDDLAWYREQWRVLVIGNNPTGSIKHW